MISALVARRLGGVELEVLGLRHDDAAARCEQAQHLGLKELPLLSLL